MQTQTPTSSVPFTSCHRTRFYKFQEKVNSKAQSIYQLNDQSLSQSNDQLIDNESTNQAANQTKHTTNKLFSRSVTQCVSVSIGEWRGQSVIQLYNQSYCESIIWPTNRSNQSSSQPITYKTTGNKVKSTWIFIYHWHWKWKSAHVVWYL